MKTPSVRLGDRKNAKHLYNVEVDGLTGPFTIEVDANNSVNATRIASRAGYFVRSVNMVG